MRFHFTIGLICMVAFSSSCRSGGDRPASPVTEEYQQYAMAVCEFQARKLDAELAAVSAAGDDLDADALETRRSAAVPLFLSLLDSSRPYSEDLAALTSPDGDDAFREALLQDEVQHRDALQLALEGAEAAETHEMLDEVLERYVGWLEETEGASDRALSKASEELQHAISQSATCAPLFD